MADVIHPGMMIVYTAEFLRADGSPGEIEGGRPEWSLSDTSLANLVVEEADPFMAKVQHNGTVATGLTVMAVGDGDLGIGVHRVVLSREIEMASELGAVGGNLNAGVEEPIS